MLLALSKGLFGGAGLSQLTGIYLAGVLLLLLLTSLLEFLLPRKKPLVAATT
jgi:hypothetical protein